MRTTTIILLSCVLGVLVGLATAHSALTINAWNPELEYKKHADIIRDAGIKASDPNAKAVIEETVYDFGLKDVKEKGKHDFYIKNAGTAPLSLEVNATTCTCTGIDLSVKWGVPTKSLRLAPGQTATATVHYDAERATTGSYSQGGTIVSNDPDNREIVLQIKGIFTSPVVLSPAGAFFSNVPSGETRKTNMRIFGFEKSPALVLDSPDWRDRERFDLTLTPSELTDPEKEDSMHKHATAVYDAEITVKPGLPLGSFQERFYVKTNYPSEPSFEFLARGQITGSAFTVSGMSYDKERGILQIGRVSHGQRLTRDLSIQFAGSAALRAQLKIKEVKPDWLDVKLTEPRDIGGEAARRRFYTLTVDIPATAPICNFIVTDADHAARVVLDTGLEESPIVHLPILFAVVE